MGIGTRADFLVVDLQPNLELPESTAVASGYHCFPQLWEALQEKGMFITVSLGKGTSRQVVYLPLCWLFNRRRVKSSMQDYVAQHRGWDQQWTLLLVPPHPHPESPQCWREVTLPLAGVAVSGFQGASGTIAWVVAYRMCCMQLMGCSATRGWVVCSYCPR